MGATYYTFAWAEQRYKERITRPLDKHEQQALLLVYRATALRALERLSDAAYDFDGHADRLRKDIEDTPELIYRDGTFRVNDRGNEVDVED